MDLGLRAVLASAGVIVALGGSFLGGRVWSIHQQTSDWVLWPKEVPSKVQFAGREYNCGPRPEPVRTDFSNLTAQGTTAGGAEILALASTDEDRVFIVVKAADGSVGCGLMGGP